MSVSLQTYCFGLEETGSLIVRTVNFCAESFVNLNTSIWRLIRELMVTMCTASSTISYLLPCFQNVTCVVRVGDKGGGVRGWAGCRRHTKNSGILCKGGCPCGKPMCAWIDTSWGHIANNAGFNLTQEIHFHNHVLAPLRAYAQAHGVRAPVYSRVHALSFSLSLSLSLSLALSRSLSLSLSRSLSLSLAIDLLASCKPIILKNPQNSAQRTQKSLLSFYSATLSVIDCYNTMSRPTYVEK